MKWEEQWDSLLKKPKLKQKVMEMDQVDQFKNHTVYTEEICHCIYMDYSNFKGKLEDVKEDIWRILEQFPGVHLHTSRIKSMDSLLEKVINKRHEWLADDESKYARINVGNYKDIISDLIGLRLIINYRGHWSDLHDKIIQEFPFDEDGIYEEDKLLSHSSKKAFQAEIPKVYFAEGDDVRKYIERHLIPKKHKMNYRSIHYTVSYQNVYVEIQVRTIYDEAWSDCDHNYVYKHDDNKSHTALEQMSGILAKLTNLSNDLGEQMKDVFDAQSITERAGEGWETSQKVVDEVDRSIRRIESIEEQMKFFRSRLFLEEL